MGPHGFSWASGVPKQRQKIAVPHGIQIFQALVHGVQALILLDGQDELITALERGALFIEGQRLANM
jgi:hypothetical protein